MTNKKKAIDNFIDVLDSFFFKALAEPVRIEILKFLLLAGRSNIATVAENIQRDRSVLSRHLHLMTEAGILKSEKVVRSEFFEVDGETLHKTVSRLFTKVNKAIEACCPR